MFPQITPIGLKLCKLEEMAKNTKITVVLDWLSIRFQHAQASIPQPEFESNNFTFEAGQLSFHYTGKGNQHLKYIWKVFYTGEHVATMLSHTRNRKFVKENICKVDFKNHLFYNGQIWTIYDLLTESLQLVYKGVIRADIAIDGANYILEICNLYAKQSRQNKVFEFLGKSRIDNKVLDRASMKYQNFKIGSPKSGKEITIYNKSLEIVKSGKDYIQKFWLQNGIIEKLMEIPDRKKRTKSDGEKIYLEGYKNVFRIELRLNGKAINEIYEFKLDLLKTPEGLISIMKLHTKQFFDAIWIDDTKTDRCTRINLIPYSRFKIIPLSKVKVSPRTDLYKTKLSINKNIKQLYTGILTPDNASVYEMILFDVKTYELHKWFKHKHAEEWSGAYSAMNENKAYVQTVETFIADLISQFPDETETDEYLNQIDILDNAPLIDYSIDVLEEDVF